MIASRHADRWAGAALVAAAAGTIITMSHHPSNAHSSGLARGVHGLMIVWLALLAWGLFHFARRRGLDRPLVLLGAVAVLISLAGHLAAATINGFVVPALADPSAPPISHDIFRLAWHSNQAFATLGVYATCAAYLLWSLDLLPERWALALAGLIASIVPAALLASGTIRLDVNGAFFVYAVHGAWAALLGICLFRGLGNFDESRGHGTSDGAAAA